MIPSRVGRKNETMARVASIESRPLPRGIDWRDSLPGYPVIALAIKGGNVDIRA